MKGLVKSNAIYIKDIRVYLRITMSTSTSYNKLFSVTLKFMVIWQKRVLNDYKHLRIMNNRNRQMKLSQCSRVYSEISWKFNVENFKYSFRISSWIRKGVGTKVLKTVKVFHKGLFLSTLPQIILFFYVRILYSFETR